MNKKYIVYNHTNKINNKIYIGITTQKPNDRWRSGYGYIGNQHFFRAIKKYGWDNFNHEILYENLEENEALEKEKELIQFYNSNNSEFGYNKDNGGRIGKMTPESIEKVRQWHLGRKLSEETKKKISDHHKGLYAGQNSPMYGKHHTEETKRKLSESAKSRTGWKHSEETKKKIGAKHKGKIVSRETREKLSKARTGKKYTEEQKLKLRGRNTISVAQFTLDGELVAIHPSIAEASRQLNIAGPLIVNCCKRKKKQTHGYVWRYANEITDDLEKE